MINAYQFEQFLIGAEYQLRVHLEFQCQKQGTKITWTQNRQDSLFLQCNVLHYDFTSHFNADRNTVQARVSQQTGRDPKVGRGHPLLGRQNTCCSNITVVQGRQNMYYSDLWVANYQTLRTQATKCDLSSGYQLSTVIVIQECARQNSGS